MSIQLQPPLPLVTLVKTESRTVIKNESPEEALEEEISTDIKDIDIVYQPLCEDLIKSETVLENILENKHVESSVQTQVLVKAENSPFIKTENITQRNKSEDTSDGNVSRSTGQGVVEVQGLNEHFNTLDNLETNEQLVTFSSDLNSIRKAKLSKKTNVAEFYNTLKTISWKKEKEKIKVIKAPLIPVEPHEYTSLGKHKHVCNHCQCVCTKLFNLKRHINHMHREVTTRYQCPYCPYYYKSKWKIQEHIISKHKAAKDIQWFQCHLCEKKFKFKYHLTGHMLIHLTHEQKLDSIKIEFCPICGKEFTRTSSAKYHMRVVHNKEDRNKGKRKCPECEYTTTKKQLLVLHIKNTHKNYEKRYHYCNKCNYKTYKRENFNTHKLNHIKPEEIQYFYCYHCSFKSKHKNNLKIHIFRHFKKEEIKFNCYICDFMTLKRDMIIKHLKKHFKHRTKSDEVKCKYQLENHTEIRYHYCDKCDYKTDRSISLKRHKIIHLKPEEIPYFYCYHCSFKSKHKNNLKTHIFRHFKNGNVPFHCYICDFMTFKRELIIVHIKKTHSKVQIKSEINEGS